MTEQQLYAMTPQELTTTMLEALVLQYARALKARQENRFEETSARLQKAYGLLVKLQEGLSDDGGIIAGQLDYLYTYLGQLTVEAAVTKDARTIASLQDDAAQLYDTWRTACENTVPAARGAHHSIYEGMSY